FFVLLYQVQLYSGMFLQAFFFFSNIYGWIIWSKQLSEKEAPTVLSGKWRLWIGLLIVASSVLVGIIIQQLPHLFPSIFQKPASQVYFDAFVAIASIAGQIMLTRRIFDNWYIWLIVNCVSVFVFFRQGLYLLTIEYLIFVLLAIKGIVDWRKTTR
ncbi:MAG: nicotinamide riboside transporter PnuC, partial [Paludibacter sp.]